MHSLYPILLLPCALLMDILLGDPPNRWHPVCAVGAWARTMEQFWKQHLGKSFLSGLMATLCTLVPFLLIAAGSTKLALFLLGSSGETVSWLIALLALYFCMAPNGLARHAKNVGEAAKSDNLEQSRHAVAMIVGRDTQSLDMPGILRAAIESVAENLTDGVLSTLFWATIGMMLYGACGCTLAVVLHRSANILDALWGKKNEEYRHFGTCAARMDDILNYAPARLSLPLISLATLFIKGTSPTKALILGWKYRYAHASPNSAWSEATFAGALDLQLSGPITYKGIPANYPYIGEGRRNATLQDLRLSINLMWASTILMTVLCALIQYFQYL
ncbi:MAG: adenosylcobinamide-phosphate synthase CbiB [Akkermansia sp.]